MGQNSACITTAMVCCTAMDDRAVKDRLHLAQMLSPAFPIGGFAYSQGLEQVMATGQLGPDDIADWVADVLEFGTPQMDAVIVAQARSGADPEMLTDLIRALASSVERDIELMEQGRAFCALVAGITGKPFALRPYPVAVGLATRDLDVPMAEVLALFLHGAAAQMISAATRFLPLGQTYAQTILSQLAPLMTRIAERSANMPLDRIGSFTPGADMAGMHHEALEVRIFRT